MSLEARVTELAEAWPATSVSIAVLWRGEVAATVGDRSRTYDLASLTKLLTAWAVHVAREEETISLTSDAGPAGSTVAHLLSHASGMAPDGDAALAEPGARRIYSNAGYERLARTVEEAAGLAFATYCREAVLDPLSMRSTTLGPSAAHGTTSCLDDMVRFAGEMMEPDLLASTTWNELTRVHLPDLGGVLPGFGRHDPNPWGLGPERRGHKRPHWTGTTNSDRTFGHFGRGGSFVWVDPAIDTACVALTDEPFGPWAVDAWPAFNDAVIEELPRS